MEGIDTSKYDDSFMSKLINLSFSYYDLSNTNFEEAVQDFVEASTSVKSSEINGLLKFFVDLISKEVDDNTIIESLSLINLSKQRVESFIDQKHLYCNNIENMKLALAKKKNKSRIEDFQYSFFVKYVDSFSDKVEFKVKLSFKYRCDDGDVKSTSFETSISQFYQLLNDFSKIETIVKTLI